MKRARVLNIHTYFEPGTFFNIHFNWHTWGKICWFVCILFFYLNWFQYNLGIP